jgi:hypothetical protein
MLCGDVVICLPLHVSVSADVVTIWLTVMWGAHNEICLQNMEMHTPLAYSSVEGLNQLLLFILPRVH